MSPTVPAVSLEMVSRDAAHNSVNPRETLIRNAPGRITDFTQ
jgi:hypothetical protein